MSATVYVVRVGNRDNQEETVFVSLAAAEKHARKELTWRWAGCMTGAMPTDLDSAIEEFGSMSSSFEQLEIEELTAL